MTRRTQRRAGRGQADSEGGRLRHTHKHLWKELTTSGERRRENGPMLMPLEVAGKLEGRGGWLGLQMKHFRGDDGTLQEKCPAYFSNGVKLW